MSFEFLESEIVEDLKNLMKERIRPEPEYDCLTKYFALQSTEKLLKGEEILHLINSHGVQLRSDVKYWLDGREEKNGIEKKTTVPVLEPKNFELKDYNDVVAKLQELPSEWTIIQITKKFSVNDILKSETKDEAPGINITKFPCGEQAYRIQPYCVAIDVSQNMKNIFKAIKNLVKLRRDYFSMGKTNKHMYDAYYKTNSQLQCFVKDLEQSVLKQWSCLFHGRLEDSDLEKKTLVKVEELIASFVEKTKLKFQASKSKLDIIYQVVLSAHFLKNKEILSVIKPVLYESETQSVKVMELMLLVENIKMLNLSRNCALKRASFNPIILIVDKEFENVPWEMITPLTSQPVCRISSFQFLYALYKYHQPYIKDGFSMTSSFSCKAFTNCNKLKHLQTVSTKLVEIDCIYSLINPGKDLELCEKQMKEFLKKRLPWVEVEVGIVPPSKDLISKMEKCTAYLYCGHGSGMQYLKTKDLKKAFLKGLLLLFGCSSNIPRGCGGRTPHQSYTYTYIMNGCPCVIGCLQDVSSADADAACEEMLASFMPSIIFKGSDKLMADPREPNVLKAMAIARKTCLRYWSKSAFVARGLPCKTMVGDIKTIISQLS